MMEVGGDGGGSGLRWRSWCVLYKRERRRLVIMFMSTADVFSSLGLVCRPWHIRVRVQGRGKIHMYILYNPRFDSAKHAHLYSAGVTRAIYQRHGHSSLPQVSAIAHTDTRTTLGEITRDRRL